VTDHRRPPSRAQGYVFGWLYPCVRLGAVIFWGGELDWLAWGTSCVVAFAAISRQPWGWYLLVAVIPLEVVIQIARFLASEAWMMRPAGIALAVLIHASLNAPSGLTSIAAGACLARGFDGAG
jgi:hypothetical protein